MASQFMAVDSSTVVRRVKKVAKPTMTRIAPDQVVARLHVVFRDDMARLAE